MRCIVNDNKWLQKPSGVRPPKSKTAETKVQGISWKWCTLVQINGYAFSALVSQAGISKAEGKMKILLSISLSVFLFLAFHAAGGSQWAFAEPVVGDPPQTVKDNFVPEPEEYDVQVWVEGLEIPWSLVFLSRERALVTERSGNIRLIENGELRQEPYKEIEEVEHVGEGGLMGLARHPDYPDEPYIYAMYTYRENGSLYNGVARYEDTGSTLRFVYCHPAQ